MSTAPRLATVKMQKMILLHLLFVITLFLNACANGTVSLTSTGTQTPTALPSPTVTVAKATPIDAATVTSLPSPTVTTVAPQPTAALTLYRNANPYLPKPQFEVSYDPAVWSLDQTMESNDRLLHRTIKNCDFRLQAGPIGAQSVAKTELAGREWTISLVQPNILLYWFSYKTIGFDFGLVMPTDYSPTEKNPCQVQAEQVIDTFRIIEP
jgi:hypothetical protein